jgi:hypothetical protein
MFNWKGIRKVAGVALFKVLCYNLPGRLRKNTEKSFIFGFPSRDLNTGPVEYEAGGLTIRPRPSFLSLWNAKTGHIAAAAFWKTAVSGMNIGTKREEVVQLFIP